VQQSLLTLQSATDGLFGSAREQQLHVQAELLFGHGILARHHADFTEAFPQITMLLNTALHSFEHRQGFFDVRIVFGTPLVHETESDVLVGERLYPVAIPAIAETIHAARDLLDFPLIEVTTHRAGWAHVLAHLGEAPVSARYAYADTSLVAMSLASEGVGIALARAPVSDKAMEGAGVVPCLPGFETSGRESYHLVYPERAALRRPARQFREWLLDLCQGL
jgi:DNA-binding transcriptional LysR family regulator